MLTLVTTPKPFTGHVAVIQRNALLSWTLLKTTPEILLVDRVPGAEEVARELGIRFLPEVERNAYGTPLARAVFELGQRSATFPLMGYVNADVILQSDFVAAALRVRELLGGSPFLLIGRRWNVARLDPRLLDRPNWEADLRGHLARYGFLDRIVAMDYFLFPRGFPWKIPPFAIGRSSWDSWFIYQSSAMKVPVIDGTDLITVVHQDHGYAHFHKDEPTLLHTPEGRQNLKLLGVRRRYTIADATHVLTREGLVPRRNLLGAWTRRFKGLEIWATYYLRGVLWPYSYPLYVVLRGVKRGVTGAVRACRAFASRARPSGVE